MSIFSSAGSVPNPMEFLNSISQQAQRGLLTLDQANMVSQAYVQALPRGGSHLLAAVSAWATLLGRVVAGHTTFEAALEDWKQWLQTGLIASNTQTASRLARPDFGAGIRPFGGVDPVVASETLDDRDEKGGAGGLGVAWQAGKGTGAGCPEVSFKPHERPYKRQNSTYKQTDEQVLVCGFNNLEKLDPEHRRANHVIESTLVVKVKPETAVTRIRFILGNTEGHRDRKTTTEFKQLKRTIEAKSAIKLAPSRDKNDKNPAMNLGAGTLTFKLTGKKATSPPRNEGKKYNDNETNVDIWYQIGEFVEWCTAMPVRVVVPARESARRISSITIDNGPRPRNLNKGRIQGSPVWHTLVHTTVGWDSYIYCKDQFGDPIHSLYHTSKRGWTVCHEKFEAIAGKDLGSMRHMADPTQRRKGGETLLLENGWIRMTNRLSRIREDGSFIDQVQPHPINFQVNVHGWGPKSKAQLDDWVDFFLDEKTTTWWEMAFTAKTPKKLDANNGTAKHSVAAWGHIFGSKTRTIKVLKQDEERRRVPQVEFTDK